MALAYMKGTLGWGFWTITSLRMSGMIRASGWWRTVAIVASPAAAFVVFGEHAFFSEHSFSPFLPIAVLLFGAGVMLSVEILAKYKTNLQNNRATLLVLFLAIARAHPFKDTWQIVF